jgi:hypothetical protein
MLIPMLFIFGILWVAWKLQGGVLPSEEEVSGLMGRSSKHVED